MSCCETRNCKWNPQIVSGIRKLQVESATKQMCRQNLRYRYMHAESTEIFLWNSLTFWYIFKTCLWNPGTYRHKILSSAQFGLAMIFLVSIDPDKYRKKRFLGDHFFCGFYAVGLTVHRQSVQLYIYDGKIGW